MKKSFLFEFVSKLSKKNMGLATIFSHMFRVQAGVVAIVTIDRFRNEKPVSDALFYYAWICSMLMVVWYVVKTLYVQVYQKYRGIKNFE
jgi:hypothetical protein